MGYLGTIVYFLMYSSLAIVAWCILFIGPISDLLKGETIFTERLEIIDGNPKIHKFSVKIFRQFLLFNLLYKFNC